MMTVSAVSQADCSVRGAVTVRVWSPIVSVTCTVQPVEKLMTITGRRLSAVVRTDTAVLSH